MRQWHRIITIASIDGFMGLLDLAPYGAAKAGIIGLTRAKALELEDYGIPVNAIAPGPIDTELLPTVWADRAREMYEDRASQVSIRRLGSEEANGRRDHNADITGDRRLAVIADKGVSALRRNA